MYRGLLEGETIVPHGTRVIHEVLKHGTAQLTALSGWN